jgi:N-methylhydantoinase A
MLLTDLSSDYVRSHFSDANDASWAEVLALFAGMTDEGHAWLDREDVARADRRFKRVLDARYRGQNFEVKVDCDGLDAGALPELIQRFHAAHKLAYGYAIPTRDVEFVSARVQAIGAVPKAPQPKQAGGASLAGAVIATRQLYVDARLGWREAAVYQRERLPVGVAVAGPAVINEMSATTIVLSGQSAVVDPWGNIVLNVA